MEGYRTPIFKVFPPFLYPLRAISGLNSNIQIEYPVSIGLSHQISLFSLESISPRVPPRYTAVLAGMLRNTASALFLSFAGTITLRLVCEPGELPASEVEVVEPYFSGRHNGKRDWKTVRRILCWGLYCYYIIKR